jgi:hypothetical protein
LVVLAIAGLAANAFGAIVRAATAQAQLGNPDWLAHPNNQQAGISHQGDHDDHEKNNA